MVCLVKASIVLTPSEGKNVWCLVKANSFVLRTSNGARCYVRLNYIMQLQMLRAIQGVLSTASAMVYCVVCICRLCSHLTVSVGFVPMSLCL